MIFHLDMYDKHDRNNDNFENKIFLLNVCIIAIFLQMRNIFYDYF